MSLTPTPPIQVKIVKILLYICSMTRASMLHQSENSCEIAVTFPPLHRVKIVKILNTYVYLRPFKAPLPPLE